MEVSSSSAAVGGGGEVGSHPSTEPVEAFYKIEFEDFSYYLQTLSVTIGRRVQVSLISVRTGMG